MEQLLIALLEAAKKDRKGLIYLKETAVKCQQFELASQIRSLETSLFPETEYIKLEKLKSAQLRAALELVLKQHVDTSWAWQIKEVVSVFNEKGGQFSVDDATEIAFKRIEIFGE